MSRTDLSRVTASLNGLNLGVFTGKDGFDVESEDTQIREEAGGDLESLGGTQTVTDGTLTRTYKPERDGLLYATLKAACGKGLKGARMVVNDQDLDVEYAPVGSAVVVVGALKSVARSAHNANENGERTITLTVTGCTLVKS